MTRLAVESEVPQKEERSWIVPGDNPTVRAESAIAESRLKRAKRISGESPSPRVAPHEASETDDAGLIPHTNGPGLLRGRLSDDTRAALLDHINRNCGRPAIV